MVKGRGRKNPPYRAITDAKWDSLGETLTVKEALDLWWNSIRVRMPDSSDDRRFLIYKCHDGEYVLDDMADALGMSEEEVLKLKITLDENYEEDSDGYPIAFAELKLKTAKGKKTLFYVDVTYLYSVEANDEEEAREIVLTQYDSSNASKTIVNVEEA